MTGLSYKELYDKLDEVLPQGAYKAVPGGANLTDIGPDFMREFLNTHFGMCGYGWGYEYDGLDVDKLEVVRKRGKPDEYIQIMYESSVKKLTFWYRMTDAEGKGYRFEVSSSGGNESDNRGYAMSGSITNALGKAVSNIGFQRSVYLGRRSHTNAHQGQSSPRPAQQPAPKQEAAKPAINENAVNEAEYGIPVLAAAISRKTELGLPEFTADIARRHLAELKIQYVASHAGYVAAGKALVAKLTAEQAAAKAPMPGDEQHAPPQANQPRNPIPVTPSP